MSRLVHDRTAHATTYLSLFTEVAMDKRSVDVVLRQMLLAVNPAHRASVHHQMANVDHRAADAAVLPTSPQRHLPFGSVVS